MLLSIEESINSFSQFITVIVLFVFVLGITYLTTRYIAGYQKSKFKAGNMELIEGLRISNSKYLQIVRVGNRYLVMAVCKDTITLLAELKEEELVISEEEAIPMDFKNLLEKAKRFRSDRNGQDTDKGK